MEQDKFRRFYSYPADKKRSSLTNDVDFDEADFTANQVVPVSVPLNKVTIGSITYSPGSWSDVEVLYELESADILIRCNIEGDNGEPPGTYRISGVSAANLSLFYSVPGSLESMVSRLILELDNDIVFEPSFQASSSSQEDIAEDNNESLKTRIIKMSASAHEAGHLRDILLFLKCENIADLNPDLAAKMHVAKKDELKPSKLTFLDFLPVWVMYIPWFLYSKTSRIALQRVMLIYYIFSVVWAFWQLYRHVEVIQVVLEPLIEALKWYLASVVEYTDLLLSMFTQLWHKYLSPLNVLYGLLFAPVTQVLVQLRTLSAPLLGIIGPYLTNSTLITSLRALFSLLFRLCVASGSSLWSIVTFVARPFSGIWRAILEARLTVGGLDFQRLRLNWVLGIVVGSLRSIGTGFAKLVGYTQKTKKKRQAITTHSSQERNLTTAASTPDQTLRQRRMPMYYNSPLN